MHRTLYHCFIVLLGAYLLSACTSEAEEFTTSASARLEFSVDTLRFDTVFTEVGSATRSIRIYNRNDKAVKIANVYLENGESSRFRINVDGIPGPTVEDVTVYGRDSIYVFAEVTVDPDQPVSESPFVIGENLIFETNGNTQSVLLEAWGQNANYFPSRFNGGVPVVLTCNDGEIVWDDPKPYVVYGAIFIDECALRIAAGTRVYVHGGIARNELFGTFNDGILYTLENGRLIVDGTAEDPVVIQGDRLEEAFRERDGQWNGIILGPGSRGNRIEFAEIKNSIFGVYVDSAATLDIRNAQIYNTSSSGLVGVRSTINAENCLLYNNFATAVQILHGGDYRFDYCTLASFGVDASALSLSNGICYDDPITCMDNSVFRLNARFRNSILFGTRRDEIRLTDFTGGQVEGIFNVDFEHCVVRSDELLAQQDSLYGNFFEDICSPCFNGDFNTTLFKDANQDDYHLDSLSVALQYGSPIKTPRPIAVDLMGKLRDPEQPDAGALEWEAQ